MPYANNNGIRIYYEVLGKGQPVILHHGFALDHSCWSDTNEDYDWVGALENDFRLILIDARGHGASDKPHSPQDYQVKKRASDVIAVLDDLHLKKAHFIGYSMGGWIGFALACFEAKRFHSFILGGAIAGDDFADKPHPMVQILKQDPETSIGSIEEMMQRPMPSNLRKVLLANDNQALIANSELKEWNGLEAILPSINVPCLIFAGDKDDCYSGARRASELMPNATFLSLHGDHMTPYLPQILPRLKKFLREGR